MGSRLLTGVVASALVLSVWGATALAQAPGADALDSEAPVLTLGGKRGQPLGPALEAVALCSERCEFEASARVEGVPGLRTLRVVTPAKAADGGTRIRFEVRVSRRAHKLINAALHGGARVRVRIDVTAYDLAENASERSRWIRVRGS